MPFKYNPPTRSFCRICEELAEKYTQPIIHNTKGKASSANNFPFHNWYNFVLGYTPEFPQYIIEKYRISPSQVVLDPFMGTGTTLVSCKQNSIPSYGVDANDYFIEVAKAKLNWDLDPDKLDKNNDTIICKYIDIIEDIDFGYDNQVSEFNFVQPAQLVDYNLLASQYRTKLLDERYICDRPLVKLATLKNIIRDCVPKHHLSFFQTALSSIIVPVSNVRYGPGFGVGKPKGDIDVLGFYKAKVERMISDLRSQRTNKEVQSKVFHGDARKLDELFSPESIDYMITSPPYPGDHEYTKHTRLELIFMDYATSNDEFRVIKKRMLRGSTTNIYKEDNERRFVDNIKAIHEVTRIVDERLKEDGATSGFEKLYTKLIWEYFGGMYRTFLSAKNILKPNGKFSLLVSDSHAFKMTHIKTAEILAEVALNAGFKSYEIELWQNKISTSHKYNLHENILTVSK